MRGTEQVQTPRYKPCRALNLDRSCGDANVENTPDIGSALEYNNEFFAHNSSCTI
jgi:hypothetical protein